MAKTCTQSFLGGKAGRSSRFFSSVQEYRTNGCVRANQGAQVALDAFIQLPFRYIHSSPTFFVLGGASRPGAVFQTILGDGGNRQAVALLTVHDFYHFLDEFRVLVFYRSILSSQPSFRNGYLVQFFNAVFNGSIVLVYHCLALFLVVGLIDGIFHGSNSLIDGNDIQQFEESSLQNGVGAVPQSNFPGNGGSINGVELGFLGCQGPFHGCRQVGFQFCIAPAAV